MNVEVFGQVDVKELLDRPSFGKTEVSTLHKALCANQVSEVRDAVEQLRSRVDSASRPARHDLAKVGIGLYLLGQHRQADQYLSRASDDAVACFYHALVLTSLQRHEEAGERFDRAARLGYDPVECALKRAGSLRALGRLDEAEAVLKGTLPEGASRAEYSFQMGCILADRGDTYGAVEYLERAVDMDPRHPGALFALANFVARYGDEREAIELYERALSRPPFYLGALVNLGLLYEDVENYAAAAFCFRRVLQADPTNQRARLFLKDVEATERMEYSEDELREEARLRLLLNRPVTDFELSVRSRNCLQQLGIRTLGDLTRVTEEQLLSSRNFGETSLKEIRELMEMHGLEIGQLRHTARQAPRLDLNDLPPEQKAWLRRPVTDLNLSARARKCMSRLGIATVGDLVARSADELLAVKNFGVTSLNEVRAKLEQVGLRLRGD